MTEWYKSWFETDEYLEIYRHRNKKDAENLVDLINGCVVLQAGAGVLDFACGSGRHSIVFAEMGYNVLGVDLSFNLLKTAKKNAAGKNINVNFVRCDLREACFKINFDMILNLFTSFGYFRSDKENISVLENAWNLTADNGYFVFDFLNKKHLEKNIVPYSEDSADEMKFEQFRSLKDNRVEKKIVIHQNGMKREFFESVRLFSPRELKSILSDIGYKIQGLYGDYEGRIFEEENSSRFIAICKKEPAI